MCVWRHRGARTAHAARFECKCCAAPSRSELARVKLWRFAARACSAVRTSVLLRGMLHALPHRDRLVSCPSGGQDFVTSGQLSFASPQRETRLGRCDDPAVDYQDRTSLEIVIELARRMSLGRTYLEVRIHWQVTVPREVKLGKESRGSKTSACQAPGPAVPPFNPAAWPA